jgi:hypothetical protein
MNTRRTIKLVFGGICVLFNLAVLLTGLWLIIVCVPGVGEGGASAAVKFLGEVSGINGHAVGIFIGAAMAILSMMDTHKAFREAATYEKMAIGDVVRHHSPLL